MLCCALGRRAAQLGMERQGLVSSAIELDMDASDALLALQETLLRSERLSTKLTEWDRLSAPSPAS